MIIIEVKHRIGLRNGDYTSYISRGAVRMVFKNKKVKESTATAMKKNKEEFFEDDTGITQYWKGKTEEEIYKKSIEVLEELKKRKIPFWKLDYKVWEELE